MPNSRPNIWKPPITSELGEGGILPPVLVCTVLSLAVGARVGDVFRSESSFLVKSGSRAFERLCALLGFFASDRKGRKPSTSMRFLGADGTLLKQAIRTGTKAERARNYAE